MAALVFLAAALTAHAQTYSIDWFTVDGGGGTSTGGVYSVSGTIGQPDAGTLSGGSFTLEVGFWAVASEVALPGAPVLHISHASAATVKVWWLSPSPGFVLQVNTSINDPNGWTQMPAGTIVTDDGTTRSVTVSSANSPRFYRLRKP